MPAGDAIDRNGEDKKGKDQGERLWVCIEHISIEKSIIWPLEIHFRSRK